MKPLKSIIFKSDINIYLRFIGKYKKLHKISLSIVYSILWLMTFGIKHAKKLSMQYVPYASYTRPGFMK
ncbi:hypothetical protein DASC09_030690 [Saccharomycopsis crataegensis]|uniref:Uncharacterized protein n=1 Tax=Saccharomycopsis crataegensis TaxID=43959 RepID=A0AAV5QMT0_9ASCO|nr:hypothetical protein DASC09_030690 [Saccharomycopsis crataegensis]